MKKVLIFIIYLAVLTCSVVAETGNYTYESLNFPSSVVAAGSGGTIVSSPEKDLGLAYSNPAALSMDLHNTISVGYMNYVSDIQMGHAAYTRKAGKKSSWMAGIKYLDYGTITQADAYGVTSGQFHSQDLSVSGGYSILLGEHWRGGVMGSFLYSNLGGYTSVGMAFDLGVMYLNPDKLLYAGLTVKGLGAQFKGYDDKRETLPWDVQIGITKQLRHAPLRLSLTAWGFNSGSYAYYSTDDEEYTNDDTFLESVAKHLLFAIDIIPTDNLLFTIGFNPRRRMELQTSQRSILSGFSAGFAFKVKSMQFGASFAKYHVSGNSLQFTAALQLH